MPYDSAGEEISFCKDSTLPDFPLCGFKIMRAEKEYQAHLETAIDLLELLRSMRESVLANESVHANGSNDTGHSLDDSCRNDKNCIAGLIYNYGSQHIQDFNGDNKINCDDLGILLYVQKIVDYRTTIECTTFWMLY